jgi:hypothetical protein
MEEQPLKKNRVETTSLDALKKFTVVVADTGEFSTIQKFSPQDVSLLAKVARHCN